MSAAEKWPTEAVLTPASEAAAREAYGAQVRHARQHVHPSQWGTFLEWDDLDPVVRFRIADSVTSIIWAALSAVVDPRREAWLNGYLSALAGVAESDNPYGGGE